MSSRAKPAPFQRPTISVGSNAAQHRHWAKTAAKDLKVGDTVAEVGLIREVKPDLPHAKVTVTNVTGATFLFTASQLVNAFVAG